MSVGKKVLSSALFIFLLGTTVFAQNQRSDLEKQKADLVKKIQETERILSQTSDKKNNSIGRLRALSQQIRSRSSLIQAIQGEISLLDDDIEENQSIIESMQNDLNLLKREYAEMVYTSSKSNRGFNELTFLFSASTFNQLFMRMKYIKQYSQSRKKQGEQILIVTQNLEEQITEVEEQRIDKQSLLSEELSENNKLEDLRGEQRALVNRLSRQETKIRQQLNDQRKAEKELTRRIEAIIEEERRAASLNAVDMSRLTEAFVGEKGKLPWPVNEGFVSSKFGTHRHPTLRRVTIKNEGIDIQTSQNAKVRAIFPGKVVSIMSVPGLGNTVLVQHGEYFTVYSRLKTVIVKKGDEVQSLQELGQVLTDSENVSEVKFRIHSPNGSVNPEGWLQTKSTD